MVRCRKYGSDQHATWALGQNCTLRVYLCLTIELTAFAQTAACMQVREQRVSNLLQSLLVAACLGITPAIQQIPTGVLWGYFIFMSVKSLEGSQLWERLLLLVTDPKKRVAIMQQEHAAYLQVRPIKCYNLKQPVLQLHVKSMRGTVLVLHNCSCTRGTAPHADTASLMTCGERAVTVHPACAHT